jgi:hypothetical protein
VDATIATADLADGSVSTVKLADNSVTSAKIVDGTIATADLADGSVSTVKLADNSVTSAKIVDATIATADLADGSVSTVKLTDNSVTSAKIVDATIATADLADGSVSTVKLADNSVTSAKIADGTIATADLADGSVTAAKLAAGATITGSGAANHVAFWSGTSELSSNANLFWDNTNSRLGIGTTSPNNGYLHLNGTNTNYHGIHFTHPASGTTNTDGFLIGPFSTNSNDLTLWNWEAGSIAFGTSATTRMTINPAGNVGIGTVSPSTTFAVGTNKFNVSGADGDLTFSDPQGSITFPAVSAGAPPMMHMFASGSTNTNRMVIAHSSTFNNWGLEYEDVGDKFHFLSNGTAVLTVDLGTSRVGIGVTSPGYKLDLPNIVSFGGQGRANAWVTYSDTRVKSGQKPINYGLKEVLAMNPKRYIHHSSDFESGKLTLKEGSETIGLIAQEVYQVVPEIVSKPQDESKELWSLDYNKLVPVLIKAIQEQQALIASQHASLAELKAELAELRKLVMAQQKATANTTATIGNE